MEVIWWPWRWPWGRDLWLCHQDFGELLVRVHRSGLSVSQVPIPKRKVAVPCPLVWFMSANGQEESAGWWEAGTREQSQDAAAMVRVRTWAPAAASPHFPPHPSHDKLQRPYNFQKKRVFEK